MRISFTKDKEGFHIKNHDNGISMDFLDIESIKQFVDQTGGEEYEVCFKECLKSLLANSPTLSKQVVEHEVEFIKPKIETTWPN